MPFKIEIVGDELRVVLPLEHVECGLCGKVAQHTFVTKAPDENEARRIPLSSWTMPALDGWHFLPDVRRPDGLRVVICAACASPIETELAHHREVEKYLLHSLRSQYEARVAAGKS